MPHEYLLFKLLAHGITGKVLDWIRDFLVGRSMTVRMNEALSLIVTCGCTTGLSTWSRVI